MYNCANCGKKLIKQQQLLKKQRFCCALCASRKRRKPGSKKVQIICQNCNQSFFAWPSEIERSNTKFCSHKCHTEHRFGAYDYPYDSTFLLTDNQIRSYFLGLFVSDGHLSKRKCFTLSLTDEQLVRDFAKCINYTKDIISREMPDKRRKRKWIINLWGPAVNFLLDCGFQMGVKTGKEFIPDCVSWKTFNHFVRGLFDGDGSYYVIKSDNQLGFSIVSASKLLIEQLYDKLLKYSEIIGGSSGVNKKNRSMSMYYLRFKHQDSVALGKYIYSNAEIKLERKYDVYVSMKDRKVLHERQKGKVCSAPRCMEYAISKGLCKKHGLRKYNKENEQRKAYMKNYLKLYYMKNREKLKEAARRYRSKLKDHTDY